MLIAATRLQAAMEERAFVAAITTTPRRCVKIGHAGALSIAGQNKRAHANNGVGSLPLKCDAKVPFVNRYRAIAGAVPRASGWPSDSRSS
jgi:hypothetical protein